MWEQHLLWIFVEFEFKLSTCLRYVYVEGGTVKPHQSQKNEEEEIWSYADFKSLSSWNIKYRVVCQPFVGYIVTTVYVFLHDSFRSVSFLASVYPHPNSLVQLSPTPQLQ